MSSVGEGEPLEVRAAEVLDEIGTVAARLLVLPLTRHERWYVDFVDEGDRVERVGRLRYVVRIGLDLVHQVGRLAVEGLIGSAGLIALLDLLVCPRLAAVGSRRLCLLLSLLRPSDRETGVEDPTRVESRGRGVDRRERRDRLQVRRLQLR